MGFNAAWRFALPAALALPMAACAVRRPAGWPTGDRKAVVVKATPGHMYGFAPTSWDVPGGGKIHVVVDRAHVVSGAGLYEADIAFTASLDGEEIRCQTEPHGAHVPSTRFGCWSTSGGTERLSFWMAPGQSCAAHNGAYLSTLTTPSCWNGEATLDGEHVLLNHGYAESTGSPIGYVSWTSPSDQLLLAANIVTDMQVRLYEPERAIPAKVERRLVLLTVALSWWEHASGPS